MTRKAPPSRKRTRQLLHTVPVRLTNEDVEYLDDMMVEGGFRSRAELIRSLVRAIVEDDKAAEQKAA